jgi:hypothetical protein
MFFTEDETVYTLSQREARQSPLALMVPDAAWGSAGKGGYCLGLSMVWAYLQLKGRDFPFNQASKVCRFPSWHATRVQNLYAGMVGGTGGLESARVCAAAEHAGLQVAWEQVDYQKSADQVDFGEILEANRGVFVMGLSKNDRPIHAVAMSSLDARFHWFDAEHGHFAVDDKKRFQEAVLDYVRVYKGRLQVNRVTLYKVKKLKRGIIDRIKIWIES